MVDPSISILNKCSRYMLILYLYFFSAGFLIVLGCIDCTQVRISTPKDNEVDYVNRKEHTGNNSMLIIILLYMLCEITKISYRKLKMQFSIGICKQYIYYFKNYFQKVCDPNFRITCTYLGARWPGSSHDSRI